MGPRTRLKVSGGKSTSRHRRETNQFSSAI